LGTLGNGHILLVRHVVIILNHQNESTGGSLACFTCDLNNGEPFTSSSSSQGALGIFHFTFGPFLLNKKLAIKDESDDLSLGGKIIKWKRII
jgi:hypothetical protein